MSREEFPSEDDLCYVPFLPHHSVDPEGPVVLLTDNAEGLADSMGMIWRFEPIETEAKTDGELGSIASRLDNFIRNLPDGAVCQFILHSTRHLRPKLELWEASTKTADPVLAELASSRRSMIENLSIPGPTCAFESRRFEIYFTLTVPGTWPETRVGPLQAIAAAAGTSRSAETRVAQAYTADRKKLLNLARSLESLLAQAEVRFERLGEEDCVRALFAVLNPTRARSMTPPSPAADELLRERVAQSSLTVDLDRGLLTLDNGCVRIVSVTHLPTVTRAGMLMRTARAATFLDAASDLDFVLNVAVEDQERIRMRFGGARCLATDQSRDAHQSPAMRGFVGELSDIEQEIGGGARVVSVRISAAIRGRSPDEVDDRARAVHAALQTEGFRAVIEDSLAGTLFLQTLPFGYRPDNDARLRRSRKLLTPNLAHLLPLYGSFQGTPTPSQLLLNRRGEPVFLGFFNEKAAPHAIMTGYTGGGKSVLANDQILQALRTGGRVFVIDRGGSYKKLAEILGGTYVTYDAADPRRLNPCGRSPEDGACPQETNTFLRDLLTEMVTHGKDDLSVRDQNLLSIAARKAFAAKPGKEVFLADIHAALLDLAKEHPSARDLGLCLSDYVHDGPYARFFDGPDQIDFRNRFVALDLADKALETAVTSALVMAIMHRIGDAAKEWLSEDKYLLIDEAWTLLKSPAASRFVENAARTARKQRLSLVVISQQIGDLDGATGAAIIAQSTYQLCLYQKPEAIPQAARLLQLNAREVELYESLCPPGGTEYREILVKTPWSSGVARLVLDPLSYWLTTSDIQDRTLLDRFHEKARAQGLSGREALRFALIQVALRYPRGAPASGPGASPPEVQDRQAA